jgi:excisionase family DNA binding protein
MEPTVSPANVAAKRGRLLKTAEAAALFGVPKSTLYKSHQSGELPAYRRGRTLRFWSADVVAFLEARTGSAGD